MKNKVIVLFPDYDSPYGSGAIIARRTVEEIKNKVDKVVVISEGNSGYSDIDNVRILSIPSRINKKFSLILARTGLIEDYLDGWVNNSLKYIINNEKKAIGFDIDETVSVIATCVGYLGTFKLGLELKKQYGCTLVLHFHDPIKYSLVNGEKYSNLPYASREQYERNYVLSSDKIATCSNTFRRYLISKYPQIEEKTRNYYFGWVEDKSDDVVSKKTDRNHIVITYGGVFSDVQGPEILGNSLKNRDDFTVCYVGNWQNYKPVSKLEGSNIIKIPRMGHQEYIKFLIEKSDMGFLSLSRSYFSACVPAKLYEYINTGKPILAALPESDTSDIIRNNGYGISVEYDMNSVLDTLVKMDVDTLNTMKSNLMRDRSNWNFSYTMLGFAEWVIE